MSQSPAQYSVGQLVRHRLFGYRGVIYDVDADFQGTEDWYEQMARSQPPKDNPWYHVLVDGQSHTTYVAERNLSIEGSSQPIVHPAVDKLFTEFRNGRYVSVSTIN